MCTPSHLHPYTPSVCMHAVTREWSVSTRISPTKRKVIPTPTTLTLVLTLFLICSLKLTHTYIHNQTDWSGQISQQNLFGCLTHSPSSPHPSSPDYSNRTVFCFDYMFGLSDINPNTEDEYSLEVCNIILPCHKLLVVWDYDQTWRLSNHWILWENMKFMFYDQVNTKL